MTQFKPIARTTPAGAQNRRRGKRIRRDRVNVLARNDAMQLAVARVLPAAGLRRRRRLVRENSTAKY